MKLVDPILEMYASCKSSIIRDGELSRLAKSLAIAPDEFIKKLDHNENNHLLLFLFYVALLNYGSGNRNSRKSEIIKKGKELIEVEVKEISELKWSNQRTAILKTINEKIVHEILKAGGVHNFWNIKLNENNKDTEVTGVEILKWFMDFSYDWKTNVLKKEKTTRLFTSKAFLIAREFKVHGLWPDMPDQYCYVPDIKLVQNTISEHIRHVDLFLLAEYLSSYEKNVPSNKRVYDAPFLE